MVNSITKDFAFLQGHIGDKDSHFFLTFNYDAASKEVPNGQLFFLKNDTNWSFRDFAWTGVSISVQVKPDLVCYVLGRDGEVLIGSKKGFSEERIEFNGESPLNRGPLQYIQVIENSVFAVGMGRQVYKRNEKEQWVTFELGIQSPPPKKIVGFNAIAGKDETELYAVGWGGEIWFCDHGMWTMIDSPTNLMLRRVVLANNGLIYICGQSGIILAGKRDNWNVMEYEGPITDWITMSWFKEKLYLADGYGLFTLKDGKLNEVFIRNDESFPILSLSSSDSMLLAVGSNCACVTEDGNDWRILPT